MVTGWIQSADFSTSELGALDRASATKAFLKHDWEVENSLLEERESNGDESCPAGIGLVAETGEILHICPTNSEHVMFHYHYPADRRILGLRLGKKQKTHTCMKYSFANVPSLIEAFYSGHHEQLLRGAS